MWHNIILVFNLQVISCFVRWIIWQKPKTWLARLPSMRYSAEFTAGSLKIQQSRVVADLLLKRVTEDQWRSAIYGENVLQTRSPKTAKRISVLLRSRLRQMNRPMLKLICDGSLVEATHACLASTIKASPVSGLPPQVQWRHLVTHANRICHSPDGQDECTNWTSSGYSWSTGAWWQNWRGNIN